MQDYEQARLDAETLFNSLDITANVSAPMADVQEDWPNILFNVTFARKALNLTVPYRLGVGHVDMKKARTGSYGWTQDEVFALNTIAHNPGAVLKDKALWASVAAKAAKFQRVSPKGFEVLASYCRDTRDTHGQSWESYAGELGMDADSIKGKTNYEHCCQLYHKIAALVGAANIAKLADFAAQF